MRLAIFWHDLLHYHTARIRAVAALGQESGHSVQAFILCSSSAEIPSDNKPNHLENHIKILSHDPSIAGEFSPHSKRQLLAELDKFQPDAVAIIGYTGPVARAAVGWCRVHQRAAILMLSSHAADYERVWWKEWPKRRLVSLYDAVIASGQPQIEYARQLGMPPTRIFGGYGVVDNEFWRAGAAKARNSSAVWRSHYGLPERFFLIACRLVAKKNVDGLLKAYAKYVTAIEQSTEPPMRTGAWSLAIVGDGNLAAPLQQQVRDLGLTERVHFLGYLPADAMATLYGLASAFVLPSSFAEQWGLVINEAMAAGVPVLVSKICGCVPDLVIEGETGFTFDPNDEQELVTLLGSVAHGTIDLAEMGRKAQRQIQHFSPEVFAKNLFGAADIAIQHAHTRSWRIWPPAHLWF